MPGGRVGEGSCALSIMNSMCLPSKTWWIALACSASVSLVAQTGPPPIPPIQSVTPMGTVTQMPLVQGRDGTFSALIGGKSVWLFDDTAMTKANATGNNFIDNTMSWTTNLDASQGI